LPWGPDADKSDHSAVCTFAVLAGYQVNSCVGNDYSPVLAHGRDLFKFQYQAQYDAQFAETAI